MSKRDGSVLDPHIDLITALKDRGVTDADVLRWLADEYFVKVSPRTLQYWKLTRHVKHLTRIRNQWDLPYKVRPEHRQHKITKLLRCWSRAQQGIPQAEFTPAVYENWYYHMQIAGNVVYYDGVTPWAYRKARSGIDTQVYWVPGVQGWDDATGKKVRSYQRVEELCAA